LTSNLLLEVVDGSDNGVYCCAILNWNGSPKPISFVWQPRGEFGFKLFATVQRIIESEFGLSLELFEAALVHNQGKILN
jgi:hypothetical protein